MMAEKTKVTSNPAEKELVVERVFDAPREIVFKAWTEAERLKQWFGPRGWNLTTCNVDFRQGGIWHYCMTGPGGEESWGRAVYGEIKALEWFVYTDSFSDAAGNVVPGLPVMTITVQFTEQDGKTLVTSRAAFATAEDLESLLSMGVQQGIVETWDRLEEYLATL